MTSATAAAAVSTPRGALHAATPSFVGIVRGELLKISRQWTTRLMALVAAGFVTFPYLNLLVLSDTRERVIAADPSTFRYGAVGIDATMLRVFGGALLIVVTARLIGMEYSGGTIRVILSRGVGRVQLLFGKLTAVTLAVLALSILGVAYAIVLEVLLLVIKVGSLDVLTHAPATFWQDSGVLYLTVLISLGAAILLAAAVAVLGRWLAFGMTAGIVWFPAENSATLFLLVAARLTGSNFWSLVSGDLLGPNLNIMAMNGLPARAAPVGSVTFTPPVVPVAGGHTLLVTAVWAAIFFTVALVLTSLRDVKE
ncbi:MAG TPA: ABC transporter permease [Ktedonobacterales bacterium]|jgi:ABC-type transport system involved in multi-copper enzyme maturation permease subunit|nr:ABC transporter permease [Ktedonobacterales bacterium]